MSRSCLNYFFITILLTEFFATTTHYKVLSNLSKQVYNVSELNLKSMYDWRPLNVPSFVPQDVQQLGPVDVPWTSPFRTFEHLIFQ